MLQPPHPSGLERLAFSLVSPLQPPEVSQMVGPMWEWGPQHSASPEAGTEVLLLLPCWDCYIEESCWGRAAPGWGCLHHIYKLPTALLRRSLWFSTGNTIFGELYREWSQANLRGGRHITSQGECNTNKYCADIILATGSKPRPLRKKMHFPPRHECQWLIRSSATMQRNLPEGWVKALLPQAGGREMAFTAATIAGDSTCEGIINLKTLQKQEAFGGNQISEILTFLKQNFHPTYSDFKLGIDILIETIKPQLLCSLNCKDFSLHL